MAEIDLKPEQDEMTEDEKQVFDLFEQVRCGKMSSFTAFTKLEELAKNAG